MDKDTIFKFKFVSFILTVTHLIPIDFWYLSEIIKFFVQFSNPGLPHVIVSCCSSVCSFLPSGEFCILCITKVNFFHLHEVYLKIQPGWSISRVSAKLVDITSCLATSSCCVLMWEFLPRLQGLPLMFVLHVCITQCVHFELPLWPTGSCWPLVSQGLEGESSCGPVHVLAAAQHSAVWEHGVPHTGNFLLISVILRFSDSIV